MDKGHHRLAASRFRLVGAWIGLLLWLAYPIVEFRGQADIFFYHCRLEQPSAGRDPCFSDYLPILEIVAFVLTIVLAYPFARFAFSLYAPPEDHRGKGWRLAGRAGGAGYYPSIQLAAALGILWVGLHQKNYPVALYPYHLYWIAWSVWFALGIWISWPSSDE